MDFLTGGLNAILAFLPDSPFQFLLATLRGNSFIANILQMVNWFIPVYSWVGVLEGWLVAVGIYYIYQVALRWLKAIE